MSHKIRYKLSSGAFLIALQVANPVFGDTTQKAIKLSHIDQRGHISTLNIATRFEPDTGKGKTGKGKVEPTQLTIVAAPGTKFTLCSPVDRQSGLYLPGTDLQSFDSYVMTGYQARIRLSRYRPCPDSLTGIYRYPSIVSDQPLVLYYTTQPETKSAFRRISDNGLSLPGAYIPSGSSGEPEILTGSSDGSAGWGDDFKPGKWHFFPFLDKPLTIEILPSFLNNLAKYGLFIDETLSGQREVVVRNNGQVIFRLDLSQQQLQFLLDSGQLSSLSATLGWLREMARVKRQEQFIELLLLFQQNLIEQSEADSELLDAVNEQLRMVLDENATRFNFDFEIDWLVNRVGHFSPSMRGGTDGEKGGTTNKSAGGAGTNPSDLKGEKGTGSAFGQGERTGEKNDGTGGGSSNGGNDGSDSGAAKATAASAHQSTAERLTYGQTTFEHKGGSLYKCSECKTALDGTTCQTSKGSRIHAQCNLQMCELFSDVAAIRELACATFECLDCGVSLNYLKLDYCDKKTVNLLEDHSREHIIECRLCKRFTPDRGNLQERIQQLAQHHQAACSVSCEFCTGHYPFDMLAKHEQECPHRFEQLFVQQSESLLQLKKEQGQLVEVVQGLVSQLADMSMRLQQLAQVVNMVSVKDKYPQHVITSTTHGASPGISTPTLEQHQDLLRKVTELDHSLDECFHSVHGHEIRLQLLERTTYNGIFHWKIDDFSRRFREAKDGITLSLYSVPFYTSHHGYKMCARIYLNGDGIGRGTHFSFFFVIMRGPFDALQTWPFKQKVALTLLNQSGKKHITDMFRPDPESSSFQRPGKKDMNIASGFPLFVRIDHLLEGGFIKNDTMFLRVVVDTSDLLKVAL